MIRRRPPTLTLSGLRRQRGLTQEQVAEAMGTKQSVISRLEHQEDCNVSTFLAFVEATGATLWIHYPDAPEMKVDHS